MQVTKEPISTKGPRVTAQISLPGPLPRLHAAAPTTSGSRARSRTARSAPGCARWPGRSSPRTPAASSSAPWARSSPARRFERELKSPARHLEADQARAPRAPRRPAVIHREAKLIKGIIRDLFSEKVDSLIIDEPGGPRRGRGSTWTRVDPELIERVHLYQDPLPALRRLRDRDGDPRGLPAPGGPPLGRLHHHRAHRGAGLHRREHRPLHGQEGPREDDPAHQHRRRPRDRAAAAAARRRRDHRLRLHRHGVASRTARRCSRSCAPTSRATARAPRRSRSRTWA